LLSIFGGTVFATLTGTSVANVALLGSTLGPEMVERGYGKPMAFGPILAAGGLAVMIPPTSLGVLMAAIGQFSVGKLLIAIIIPGLLLAVVFAAYIVIRCYLQPSIAPSYNVPPVPLREKLRDTVKYVVPLGIVVFLVVGVIILGIATPSEAAATGTVGMFLLVLLYRRLSWKVVRTSLAGTTKITGMMFLIISGATAFSQVMSFSGATAGLAEIAASLPVAPIGIIIVMMAVIFILGCFLDTVAIMMITLPIFVPIVLTLGFDPVWFGVIYLINIETACITPPFGLGLFVMKGVAPPDVSIGDIYKASLPFVGLNIATMALIMIFPDIAMWLTTLMA
jgi:tripartite ATP-independent transporter DctM subunit